MTLEPVEALKQRIAELESFLLNYDHAMKVERHNFKSEISALQTKLELARKALRYYAEASNCSRAILTLAQLAAPDSDYCPSCGEYLHDEMGHMCPPHSDAPEERDRAVRTDHEYDQNPFYTGPGCAVCGLPTEAHAEGAKKLKERDRAVREEVIRVLVEADTNCEMYAAIECIRREFGLEG